MKTAVTKIPFYIAAVAALVGAVMYPHLPATMATHWNAAGQVNGFMPKFWGVFLVPLIMCALAVLAMIIPRIDPRGANIQQFQKQYNAVWITVAAFFAYVYALSLAWNLGHEFDFGYFIAPGLAVLFWVIGGMLKYTQPNWFVGIRTPWTLSNETVWRKTHVFGAQVFRTVAVLILISLFFRSTIIFNALIGLMCASLVAVVLYSFLEYQKVKGDN